MGNKIEQQIINLGNSINYYCEDIEEFTEGILKKIDKDNGDLNNLTPLEVKSLHALYLRIMGYAILQSISDIFLAEKLARKLGVDLVKEDLSKGRDVPSDIIDSMLDEINRNKE